MVQLKKVFSNINLVSIELPSNQVSPDVHKYLVNKNQPFQREQYTFEESNSLFVKSSASTISSISSNSFTFFYVFNNELYKIVGASAIKIVIHSLEPRSEIMLLLEDDSVHFYAFTTEDIYGMSSTKITYLGAILVDKLPNCTINNTKKYLISLPLFKLGNFQYTAYLPFECKNNVMCSLVRFNTSSVEQFNLKDLSVISSCYSAISIKPPRYIHTNTGIFDTSYFEYFDLKNLYAILGKGYENLYFKPFCTPTGKKFVFVSEEPLDFSYASSKNSNHCCEGKFINGMLYDLENEEFIFSNYSFQNTELKWLKFFIYDDGIPHIIKLSSEKEESKFGIIFRANKKKKFSMIFSKTLPTFVSYICNHYSPKSIDEYSIVLHKRIIFAHKVSKSLHCTSKIYMDDSEIVDNDKLIVINDDLELTNIDSYAKFKAAIINSSNRVNNVRVTINKEIGVADALEIALQTQSYNNVFHLYKSDNIIVKSYKGDLGNFVLIFLDDNFEIDYSLSFFDFNVFSLTSENTNYTFLKVTSGISDFENETYIVNPISKQIFCYEDFVEFVTNHFSKPI